MAKYFGKEEEKAVKKYIKGDLSKIEKDRLYQEKLQEPIDKLVESILSVYGKKYNIFKGTGYNYNQLKMMGLSYLFKKFDKFDPDRTNSNGQKVKAYSFFGTILRNYYLKLKKDYDKEKKRKLNIHNEELMKPYESDHLSYEQDNDDYEEVFIEKLILWFKENIDRLFEKEEKRKIAYAIIEVMKNVKNLECFNKKYIYIQIREMTGIETRKITPVVKKMKDTYRHIKYNYINHGEFVSGSLSL